MTNISNFILNSDTDSFKINNEYSGTVAISGTVEGGINTRTFTIPLTTSPDLVDVYVNSTLTDGIFSGGSWNTLPSGSWVKKGMIIVPDDAGFGGTIFIFGSVVISDDIVYITLNSVQQYTGTYSLTSTNMSYKIIDYSIY